MKGPKPKKPRGPLWYLLPFAIGFFALGVGLFFVNPLAPLLLLASLAIQLPIVVSITRVNLGAGYRDRAFERRRSCREGGDAAEWLAAEEREAAGLGYKYWSRATRDLSLLNRAEPLALLGRGHEAAELLAELEEKRLDGYNRGRFDEIVALIREKPASAGQTHHKELPRP